MMSMPEDRSIEIMQAEKRKNVLTNRTLVTSEITASILSYVKLDFQNNKRKIIGQKKIFVKIVAKNFPNLV